MCVVVCYIVAGGVDRTYSGPAVKKWKRHWEHQLYKVFEFQYRMCIDSLNEYTLDLAIQLKYTNKRLTYQPSLEELRSKYYKSLKRFLDMPKTSFRGFETSDGASSGSGGAGSGADSKASSAAAASSKSKVGTNLTGSEIAALYVQIPERNSEGIYNVYASAESLFSQLASFIRAHSHWVALGSVNIEEFVDARLVDVGDWKTNFKALKQRRKEAEKIPDTQKIGCFTVSLTPFKSTVDDHLHKLSDALLLSLRKSAQADLRVVDEFLKMATNRLQTRPRTVEEMAAAKKEAKTIGESKNEMRRVRDRVALKNDLLREMMVGAVEALDLTSIKTRWDTFTDLLQVFDEMLNEQRTTLVQDIEKKIKGNCICIAFKQHCSLHCCISHRVVLCCVVLCRCVNV